MKFQSPSLDDMEKKYEEGGSSSGAKSSTKPPLHIPCFKAFPIKIEDTPISPTTTENSSNERAPPKLTIEGGRLSSMTDEEVIEFERKNGRTIDPENVDIKKLKRTIANRLSAQKSRLKKFKRAEEMEKKVRELEENIKEIKTQIESYRKNQEIQRMQNMIMEQRLDYLSTKSAITNREIEKNKEEAIWLREFLQMVNQNVLNNEVEKMKSLSVHHYEQMLPGLQNHQIFNFNSNGEHQNLGTMGGHEETSEEFLNREAFIGYHA